MGVLIRSITFMNTYLFSVIPSFVGKDHVDLFAFLHL